MEQMHKHIGKMVAERIEVVGISKAEFGRRMATSRQNVNTLLGKMDWNVGQLALASKVLGVNFFADLIGGAGLAIPEKKPGDLRDGLRLLIEVESVEEVAEFVAAWRGRKG